MHALVYVCRMHSLSLIMAWAQELSAVGNVWKWEKGNRIENVGKLISLQMQSFIYDRNGIEASDSKRQTSINNNNNFARTSVVWLLPFVFYSWFPSLSLRAGFVFFLYFLPGCCRIRIWGDTLLPTMSVGVDRSSFEYCLLCIRSVPSDISLWEHMHVPRSGKVWALQRFALMY